MCMPYTNIPVTYPFDMVVPVHICLSYTVAAVGDYVASHDV